MSRPTDDDLDDPAEIGRHGCLLPEIEGDTGRQTWGDDDEEDEDERV